MSLSHPPRRGGYQRSTYSHRSKAPPGAPPDREILDGLSPSIERINVPTTFAMKLSKSTDIRSLEFVGSYNWVDSARPTIIVPGSPPTWTEPTLPLRVQPDSEVHISHQNGYRMSSRQLLPLMKAVDTLGKPVNWPSVDLVTDRNNLRKLLRWINGTTKKEDGTYKNFRIDLELAGAQTILFNRWEVRDREAANTRAYGIKFEQATTTLPAGCEKSTGHHRIVKYDFFDLSMVVRFEVDACLRADKTRVRSAAKPATVDDLSHSMGSMQLAPPAPAVVPSSRAGQSDTTSLAVIHAGTEVKQDKILELATRSINFIENMDWTEVYPQLYLSQTPHFYLGVHSRGNFSRIQKRSLAEVDLEAQKQAGDANMQKLGRALELIQDIVIEHGHGKRLSLVCMDGILKVHERVGDGCLPPDAMARFEVE
ncbi:hypothetical protein FA95DRAFT_1489223 [Auriscalpium vulgare]|uniref:Uncharacterized protein n=1 Tax=Auriscalpium vulgare TaxID=40419 RepID=A0ACB8S008_9AGAM|nr:hypothetical protein FA95DRAFT_1489223 [Auriscalpium vulgare]